MAFESLASLSGNRKDCLFSLKTGSERILPLSMVASGEKVHVKSVSGKDDSRRFLADMGFIVGAEVSVVSEMNGSVIVSVKNTRVAISRALASRVMTV